MAEGDLVIRIFKQNVPDPKDKSKMVERYALDVYRIKNRKIVEHWRGLANLPWSASNFRSEPLASRAGRGAGNGSPEA